MSNRENAQVAAQASVDAAKLSHAGARLMLKMLLEQHAILNAAAALVSAYVAGGTFPAVATCAIFGTLAAWDAIKAWRIKI